MAIVLLSATVSLIAGLLGKVRLFFIVFAVVWLIVAALAYYDYSVHVAPRFLDRKGGDGSGIGFAFGLVYLGITFVVSFAAFSIGGLLNALTRWMKTL